MYSILYIEELGCDFIGIYNAYYMYLHKQSRFVAKNMDMEARVKFLTAILNRKYRTRRYDLQYTIVILAFENKC